MKPTKHYSYSNLPSLPHSDLGNPWTQPITKQKQKKHLQGNKTHVTWTYPCLFQVWPTWRSVTGWKSRTCMSTLKSTWQKTPHTLGQSCCLQGESERKDSTPSHNHRTSIECLLQHVANSRLGFITHSYKLLRRVVCLFLSLLSRPVDTLLICCHCVHAQAPAIT